MDSRSANTSSAVNVPNDQLLIAQAASNDDKKPLAHPDPVGQKG